MCKISKAVADFLGSGLLCWLLSPIYPVRSNEVKGVFDTAFRIPPIIASRMRASERILPLRKSGEDGSIKVGSRL